MASDKRSFSDFSNIEGQINAETGMYEFPKLFKMTDKQKVREWSIYIRLITKGSKKNKMGYNWNVFEETQVPIKQSYIDETGNFPDGIISQYWAETGFVGGVITRQPPTYPKAKNVGRANERNMMQQALISARAKYLKKREEGFDVYANLNKNNKIVKKSIDRKFFPTLAKNYKDFVGEIVYPVYVQPKLDGLRWVAYLDLLSVAKLQNVTIDNVIIYSRQKKIYPHNDNNNMIRTHLLPILIKYYKSDINESIYLDGELYKHNCSLQQINSVAKKSGHAYVPGLKFNIFDVFYPHYVNEPFEDRVKILEEIERDLTSEQKKYITVVETTLAKTKKEEDDLYKKYIAQKYEGTIIRVPSGKYLKHIKSKSSTLRSKNLLKRKEVFTDEFEVVGFTEGTRGKDVGAIIWILKVGDHTFNATPTGMTYPERQELFNKANKGNGKGFIDNYKHRMMTVEYRGLSEDGIPQHAKALTFRDEL